MPFQILDQVDSQKNIKDMSKYIEVAARNQVKNLGHSSEYGDSDHGGEPLEDFPEKTDEGFLENYPQEEDPEDYLDEEKEEEKEEGYQEDCQEEEGYPEDHHEELYEEEEDENGYDVSDMWANSWENCEDQEEEDQPEEDYDYDYSGWGQEY